MRRLIKKLIPKELFRKIEPLGHLCEAIILNVLNGFPSRGLKVIGVTGTNGKTSTAFLIHRMLQDSGRKTGLMTTVAYGVGDDIKPQQTHMTTATVPVLLKRIKAMKAEGIEWLVLETTSHALAQHRVWGVPFSISVLTNITHEHLSYHGTFERYVKAKRMLFTQTELNTKGLRTGIINGDDPNADVFAQAVSHPILYGTEGAQLQATNIELRANGVEYDAVHGDNNYHIVCNLPGSFNVYNSLAAVGVGEAVGLTKSEIEAGIAALKGVEGRMTHISEGQDFDVLVDYAHTPDSFEKLFKDMKPVVKGKLIVVFGSQGGGDEGKRAIQGELAGTYADEVIITEEDDREEAPERIFDMIRGGLTKAGRVENKDFFVVPDRTEAIQFAVDRAKKGDTVMTLGKGHEKTIEHGGKEYPWDEIGTTRTAVKSRLAKSGTKTTRKKR